MHRMLIADSDDVFLAAAKQAFSAEFEVCTCQDGETALELIASFDPQVLVINLMLPHKDGLTVLQETAQLPPVTIAITSLLMPYIEQACAELRIGYLMISPCLNALRVRVIHMVNQWQSSQTPEDLRSQVIMHLHSLSFPTHRTGYRQLCEAIPLYYQDRDVCLETVLYARIAKMLNKSGSKAVERAMRAVIVAAWKHRDNKVWLKYFTGPNVCPSNKVFFDAIADHLQE